MKKKPKHLDTILEVEYSCRYFDVVWLWLVLDWTDVLTLNISFSSCDCVSRSQRSYSDYSRITVVQMCPSLSAQQELHSQVRPSDPQVRPVSEWCVGHHHHCMAHLSRWELQCSLHKTVEVKVSLVQWCSSCAENRKMFSFSSLHVGRRSQLWNSHNPHHTLRRASDLLGVVAVSSLTCCMALCAAPVCLQSVHYSWLRLSQSL